MRRFSMIRCFNHGFQREESSELILAEET